MNREAQLVNQVLFEKLQTINPQTLMQVDLAFGDYIRVRAMEEGYAGPLPDSHEIRVTTDLDGLTAVIRGVTLTEADFRGDCDIRNVFWSRWTKPELKHDESHIPSTRIFNMIPTEDQRRHLTQLAAECLHSAAVADPAAIYALQANRVPAGQGLVDHPHVICEHSPPLLDGSTVPMTGALGLINGVMLAMGLYRVASKWDTSSNPPRFVGFVPLFEEMPCETSSTVSAISSAPAENPPSE